MTAIRRHGGAALLFVALAALWSYPLVTHLTTRLPGEGLGDNVTFVWNFWWMRTALADPAAHVFFTDRLFAPVGVDLTLHTHTALPAFLGATVFRSVTPVAAQNIVLLIALSLNGFAAYLLAVDRGFDRGAAIVAGTIFGGSPYLSLHLLGHFNLIHGWGIPLFALCLLRAIGDAGASSRGQLVWSALAGGVLVLVAYTDYYYLVYSVALAVICVGWSIAPVTLVVRPRPLAVWLRTALGVLFVADLTLVAAIAATGGFTLQVGGAAISANTTSNPLSLLWFIVILWLVLHFRPALGRIRVATGAQALAVRDLIPMLLVAAAGLAPLAIRGAAMWMGGDYVQAPHSWRTSPGGVDLATFVLGNPLNPVSGAWTSGVYTRLGIDRIEKTAWLGIVPAALMLWSLAKYGSDREVRRWLAIGIVFLIWAFGPWLRAGEVNLGLPLPQNLFAFVPILSNARMPGRAMVVVMLAVAMLAAAAISRMDAGRRRIFVPILGVLIVLDFLPAPFPTVAIGAVPSYAPVLAAQSPGAVCPIPLGYRDGYGEIGRFDPRLLLDQMMHGHPIVGGFVGRLPLSVRAAYDEIPVIRSLLLLSRGRAANGRDLALTREQSGQALRDRQIRFVLVDEPAATPELLAYVRDKLPLRLITDDSSGRRLFEVATESGR